MALGEEGLGWRWDMYGGVGRGGVELRRDPSDRHAAGRLSCCLISTPVNFYIKVIFKK